MKYIASCSFGKDSLSTIILALENNEPLDEVVYSEVMFDDETSAEIPEHREFIYDVGIPQIKKWGLKFRHFKSSGTFKDWFFKPFPKVLKYNEEHGTNKVNGWPIPTGCNIQAYKTKPIKDYIKQIIKEEGGATQYIGIAIDEVKRLERMKNRNDKIKLNEISLLEKYGYTQGMTYDLVKKYNLLSPNYKINKRDGCWFCFNSGLGSWYRIYKYHNHLFKKVLELDMLDKYMNYPRTLMPHRVKYMEDLFILYDSKQDVSNQPERIQKDLKTLQRALDKNMDEWYMRKLNRNIEKMKESNKVDIQYYFDLKEYEN